MTGAPDLIVHGARLLGAAGDAVAVRAGRIECVGEAPAILRRRAPHTRVLRARGGLLCPGFHDAHAHLVATALARRELDLHGLGASEIAALVRSRADASAPGRWIVGSGFDPRLFPGTPHEARRLLDEATSNPVLLRSHDHHSVALNTPALECAGFLPQPPEIPGGRVETDADGAPTGIARETAAHAAEECAGDLSQDERLAATEALLPELFAAGITALHDMSGTRRLDDLRALDDARRLPLTVFASVSPSDVADRELRRPGAHLHVIAMKAFLDGALGTRTAHLLQPYEDDATHRGIEVIAEEVVRDVVREAAAAGLPSWLHAIGDAAVRAALSSIESAGMSGTDGTPRLRHRVEHAQMVHDDDLPRFAALGVTASVQPIHMAEDARLVQRHWGSRSREAFPLRRLLDSGALVAFGSDTPIETLDVLAGVRCAVRRTGRDGTVLSAHEAVTTSEALRAYTAGAAHAVSAEAQMGSLAPGRRADLVLLTADVETQPEALDDAEIAATILGGDVVHGGDAA